MQYSEWFALACNHVLSASPVTDLKLYTDDASGNEMENQSYFPRGHGWHESLASLVSEATDSLLVAAPFMSSGGCSLLASKVTTEFKSRGRIKILTDLSPAHVCDGSLEPTAVCAVCDAAANTALWHVPRLHAKVYIADRRRAIVTSGNLTSAALYRNIEYGIDVRDSQIVGLILDEFSDLETAGTRIFRPELDRYIEAAKKVRETYERQQRSARANVRQAFEEAFRDAEDDLIRLRLAGGAMHTVFARTIVYLLRKYGPMATPQLHGLVKQLHPDLCDDTVDRVIDGKHFGKKWKHAVRTAQQQLKKAGQVAYRDGIWRSASEPSSIGR
jgi:hypothetical protein